MSKYKTSLQGPMASQIHSTQYKTKNMKDASSGRVMQEGKESLASMSRPAGRTSFVAGGKTASTNAK